MIRTRWMLRTALLALILTMIACTAFAQTYQTLRYGDRGPEVARMQEALVKLGYKNVTADGTFGAYTENAVRKFQKDNHLGVDGLAGNTTLTALYAKAEGAAAVTAAPEATPVIVTQQPVEQPQATAAPVQQNGSLFGGNYATLKHGAAGDRVKILQTALNSAGYGKLTVDGKFGTATLTAVMAFQRAQGLTVDGAAGRNTLARLEKTLTSGTTAEQPQATLAPVVVVTTAPTQAPAGSGSGWTRPGRMLFSGTTGDDVKSLQGRLKELGYYAGAIDGKFGTGTLTAVMAFQRDNKLTVDGVAGDKTYNKLYAASAPSAPQGTAVPQATAAPQAMSAPVINTPAAGSTSATLKKNMTGMDVLKLQGALALLDYTPNTFGVYDNVTVAAVKDFQSRNGLSADGIAGPATLEKLYSGTAARGTATGGSGSGVGAMAAPAASQLRLLHWFNDVKPALKSGQSFLIYDPATGLSWKLHLMSSGRHADVEPLTTQDTAIQYRAFGNRNDWGPKPVYVLLPDGRWTIAGLSNVPHGSQTIKNNDYNGQNCLHFLRDMDECEKNDPKTGVANQKTIRTFWNWLTGAVVN